MATAQTNPKSIFSPHMIEKFEGIAERVRADTDFMVSSMLVGLSAATLLLLFWWGIFSSVVTYTYGTYWIKTFPNTPLELSAGWILLQFADLATLLFLVGSWTYMIFYLIFTYKKPIKQVHIQKDKQLTSIHSKSGNVKIKKIKHDVCPYCDSIKVRPAGEHSTQKGRMFCKSCKEYY